ncbi:MAG: hypothetical protein FWF56_00705 [Firmicutes bacterium]|nr:hypothetical protein [Bacillota bacterium]MCL1953740.1 hypothetical protein [Bacillota bacterium]
MIKFPLILLIKINKYNQNKIVININLGSYKNNDDIIVDLNEKLFFDVSFNDRIKENYEFNFTNNPLAAVDAYVNRYY